MPFTARTAEPPEDTFLREVKRVRQLLKAVHVESDPGKTTELAAVKAKLDNARETVALLVDRLGAALLDEARRRAEAEAVDRWDR